MRSGYRYNTTLVNDPVVGNSCEDCVMRHHKGATGASMGGSVIRVKRAKMPPRADVTCPVCDAPKRVPCKQFDEKRRTMVALPKPQCTDRLMLSS